MTFKKKMEEIEFKQRQLIGELFENSDALKFLVKSTYHSPNGLDSPQQEILTDLNGCIRLVALMADNLWGLYEELQKSNSELFSEIQAMK